MSGTQPNKQTNKHMNTYMASSQKVLEPLAASKEEGRRTVTQRENVSAQYGKQSSHQTGERESGLMQQHLYVVYVVTEHQPRCDKMSLLDSLIN